MRSKILTTYFRLTIWINDEKILIDGKQSNFDC